MNSYNFKLQINLTKYKNAKFITFLKIYLRTVTRDR